MIKIISGHELIHIQIYSIPQDLNYVSYFDISMWLSAKLHYAHKYKIDAIYDFIFSDLNIFLKSTLSIQSSRFSCKIERDSPLSRLNIFVFVARSLELEMINKNFEKVVSQVCMARLVLTVYSHKNVTIH